MKIEKKDGGPARRALLSLLTDKMVLGAVAPRWDGRLFDGRAENVVAGWAVQHYKRFKKPPGKEITHYYESWCDDNDGPDVKLVEKLLQSLGDESLSNGRHESSELRLDTADKHFARVRLRKTIAELEQLEEAGEIDKAAERMAAGARLRLGVAQDTGINLFTEKSLFAEALAPTRLKSLVKYPGALGEFINREFTRASFVSFMGKSKVGKSKWLLDVVWRAGRQGRNVAYFMVGDLSRLQVLTRVACRAAKRPQYGKPHAVKTPTSLAVSDGQPEAAYEERGPWPKDISMKEAWPKVERLAPKFGDRVRFACHAAKTCTMADIERALELWSLEGWVPDVVVIDYADLLAPLNGKDDHRDQINANWVAMSSLRIKLDCCLVTATQSNAASFKTDILGRENFADDRRKFDHVTCMIGINQKDEEKDDCVQRLNVLAVRDDAFVESRCVHVAGCLATNRPVMFSCV